MNVCGDCTQLEVCGEESWHQACDSFDRGPVEDAWKSRQKSSLDVESTLLLQSQQIAALTEDVAYLAKQMHKLEDIFAAMHRVYMGGEL